MSGAFPDARELLCIHCPAIEARARQCPGAWWPCDCGAQYFTGRRRQQPRTAPVRDAGEAVRKYVHAVLAWDASVARVERQARGAASALLSVVRAGELGVLGNGCSGTKGVGHAPEPDRDYATADSEGTARYRALRGEALLTTDAVIADGQGYQPVTLLFGERAVECALAERIGLRLTDSAQRERWEERLTSGDKRPALVGAGELGERLLMLAAEAWHRKA